jgi:putative endonuclease
MAISLSGGDQPDDARRRFGEDDDHNHLTLPTVHPTPHSPPGPLTTHPTSPQPTPAKAGAQPASILTVHLANGRAPIPTPCVYILASRRNGAFYVGVSSDLARRVWEHKQDLVAGFTKRYRVHTLVWFEVHASMASALTREKAIKEWRRAWKLALIEAGNPEWRDLYEGLVQ